jgi:hypothetical protein
VDSIIGWFFAIMPEAIISHHRAHQKHSGVLFNSDQGGSLGDKERREEDIISLSPKHELFWHLLLILHIAPAIINNDFAAILVVGL